MTKHKQFNSPLYVNNLMKEWSDPFPLKSWKGQKLFAFNLPSSLSHLTDALELCWGSYLKYIKKTPAPSNYLKAQIQSRFFWCFDSYFVWWFERGVGGILFWRSVSGNILAPTRVAVAVFLYKHQPVLLCSSTDYLSPTQTRRILIWDKMKRNQRRHFCFLSFY